jgi:glycerol-3-phosphate acyltransferase PlsY
VSELTTALLVAASYLLGAVPMGVLVARLAGGTDPRTVGSGRTGGTNALRALGRKWALVVVVGDVAKGSIPVLAARWLSGGDPGIEVLCAAAAVFGSSHSVFVGFGGGRGVGTGVGTLLVLQPLVIPLVTPVFIGIILVTRFVSLGSLLGSGAILPAMLILRAVAPDAVPVAHLAWAVVGPAIVWLAHRDNVLRLVRGEERRFDLGMLGRSGRGSQPPSRAENQTTRVG